MLSLGTLTVLPEQFNDKLGVAITAEAASNDLVILSDSDGYKYVDGYKGNGGNVVIPKDVSYINLRALPISLPLQLRETFMFGTPVLQAALR